MTGKRSHILKIADGGPYLDGSPVAGLALLTHDDFSKLILTTTYAVSHLEQILGTLDGRCLGPLLLCSAGSVEGFVDVLDGSFGLA